MDLPLQSALLLSNQDFLQSLSEVSLEILQHGNNAQYLATLSELALDPKYTSAIFVTHESIFVEFCSRWQKSLQSSSKSDPIAILAALARILPLAPHLCVFVEELICRQKIGTLQVLASRLATDLTTLPLESLHGLLLALCRLLMFDNQRFARLISPAQLQALLNHSQQSVRYLAVKIICLYLHASDSAMTKILDRHCSKKEIPGEWEGKNIDYLFFTLWEQKRIKQLAQELEVARTMSQRGNGGGTTKRSIKPEDLSNTTACIGDVLVPRLEAKPRKASSLVKTETFRQNLRRFAVALNGTRSLLVTGFSGAGKSSLIRYVARELGKSDSMITLHLNEQTDAKLLVGMYTSDNSPGSFTWRAGVLTTAVLEGRWVIIEDIDRAPIEILSTILPLLERRELFVSHWGESIKAAPGFRMIATIRSYINVRGDEAILGRNSLGFRHWLRVPFLFPSNEELANMIRSRYPILDAYVADISRVYGSLSNRNRNSNVDSKVIFNLGRPIGPQDLFRWCKRLEDFLLAAGVRFSYEPISEALHDIIFVEAVDCFAGLFPDGSTKSAIVGIIAQELRISAERAHYCLEARRPEYAVNDSKIRIGRIAISKKTTTLGSRFPNKLANTAPFARTTYVLRVLESIAVAVKMAEPCLLVGETGTGKTTMIQQLADSLGYKLTVVNLSQQSEAGDLLGGYKPLNARSLAVPMKEEFDDLFEKTFSTKRNRQYIEIIGKAVSKGRWPRALALWQEALRMFDDLFTPTTLGADKAVVEPHPKRRRLDSPKYQDLKIRWDKFATKVHNFQNQIMSAPKGVVFSFVEGNIVKAARNGDWVLLDEINLASPDTLESLADLLHNGLDDTPSLLLSETGNTHRIQVHKDFRIFGAMNPATDVGKRDLPTSLRSRFSEIYIDSPDRGFDDLLSVVRAYLESHINMDVRVATDVSSLYVEIKRLAEQNQLVDGANQKPHFSLRTLTRTLVYVTDIAPTYGLRRALFEGFSMSFLTLLNKESTLLLLPLIHKYLLGSQKSGRGFLRQIPRAPEDNRQYIQFRHYWVAQGNAPIEAQPHYIITPFVEQNLLNLVRATSTRRFPVLLQGPTSSGKTSMIEHLALISGNKFVRINNHEHTDLQEYLGSYVSGPEGQLEYQEGILVNALREGYWIVLDELNLAPTDVLESLNRLLDDNKELLIPETQQLIRPHENFMLFATQNPPGMYGGRKVLSRAFRNRFLELHFDDIPEDELEVILRERSQIAPSFCSKIVAVYKKLSILRQRDRLFEQKNSFATLRDLFRWALRDADDREQLALNGFLLLAERVRNVDERLAVKRVIEDVMKVSIDEAKIYNLSSPFMPSNLASISSTSAIVWTYSMRRVYVLVAQALKRNEPVLLVGETGSGKTTICQVIAQIMNTQLHIVNAHQNLETGDLIGSQRPVRNHSMIEGQLRQDITTLLRSHGLYEKGFDSNLSFLLEEYDALLQRDAHSVSKEMRSSIAQSRARFRALFEWSDGCLVHAMRNGQHFLLDEISLADDSVLERLNSVLESARNLLLAEKGATDTLITASEGFQFLATMNPGGDYGKKELSPALRNRFTEIWVPHATDHDEILEIVQAKLLPPWVSHSSSMVAFAGWYGATFNPGAPAILIRDLLAWIEFVNKYRGPDPYLALLHGAAMVYIDGLGANPAAKVSIPEFEIVTRRRACLIKLEELFQHSMVSIYDENIDFSLRERELSLGPFKLEIVGAGIESTTYSLQAPTAKANALKIVRALQLPKPILIEGSPGVGKTTLVVVLAQLVGIPLTRINLSEQTDLMDLFGSDIPVDGADAGQFSWRDAPFLRAMQKGEWVLLDEMNLASQAVLEGLNSCFDHRGQVYISELDQKFSRHPKFTVFAAQNPHHQGGGRKGLPASFVNRFTVVYADSLTSQDLLTICSQNYPRYSLETIKSLTHCVTDIERLSLTDRMFGTRGSPWEINLRDLLRWLHLVTSREPLMLAGGPIDYKSLLFLHRFRTSEDKVAVAKILEKHLPQVDQIHTLFYNTSPSYVQVGLGFLTRHPLVQRISIQSSENFQPNMPIMESVMLCVQNNWPCLLVGPPGCGKTNLLFRLASHTGADVVNLPLNTDMDTTDLVGGYEQVDTQREILGLVRRLKQITTRKIIDELGSTGETDAEVAVLEERLHTKSPDLSEIFGLICKLANKHPSLGLSGIADECESIIRRSAEDNRARFEWIDGILVKTLTQGKWLVLDNANLCSSSVLDRLNSLLEPNGYLSINEHRVLDGSVHTVKPHPNFRLFLTMDPRHGELSRAMRNRCVELYLPATSTLSSDLEIYPECETSISRFQAFERIDRNTSDDAHFSELSSIYLDHLSVTDHELIRRWQSETAKGLIRLSSLQQSLLARNLSIQHRLMNSNTGVMLKMRRTYESMGQSLGLNHDFSDMQTINPLNNPALLTLTARQSFSSNLRLLGTFFEILVKIGTLEAMLDSIHRNMPLKPTSRMSRLERSLVSMESRSFQHDSTQPLGKFFEEMGQSLRCLIDDKDFEPQEDVQNIALFVDIILSYLRDMFDLTISSEFDEGAFQVHLMIGRSVVAHGGTMQELKPIYEKLDSLLNLFNASWKLTTGLSMEKLWKMFRPPTAESNKDLSTRMQLEELATRFDNLKWSAGAAFRDLDLMRHSIVRIYRTINSLGNIADDPFKDIREALDKLESHSSSSLVANMPYFMTEFEGFCQYKAFTDSNDISNSLSVLDLLAGRPTNSLIEVEPLSESWSLLSSIENCTGIRSKTTSLMVLRNTLPCSVIAAMEGMSEVPLRSLALLRSEADFMRETVVHLSETISLNHLHNLNVTLARIHMKLYETHEDDLERASLAKCREYLDQYTRGSAKESLLLDVPMIMTKPETPDLQLLDRVMKEYLNPSLKNLQNALKEESHGLAGTASAWILFFTGFLYAYVPDRPFDPALRPLIERNRYDKRKAEVQAKLGALQEFEVLFSGQDSSFRSQILEKQLQNLGNEPPISSIIRPQVSELTNLQGEFNNILVSIIRRSPDESTLWSLHQGDKSKIPEMELLRLNIAQAISRLSASYRAYDDVTEPLVAMLKGLDVGLAIVLLTANPVSPRNALIRHICESTPFLGMRTGYLSKAAFVEAQLQQTEQLDPRPIFLNVLALSQLIDQDLARGARQTMHETFLSLYKEWKEKLGRDQRQEVAKYSMYRYRGAEEDDIEVNEKDFHDLFPDFNEETNERIEVDNSQHNPKTQAQHIARCQQEIFRPTKSIAEQILSMLANAARDISTLWESGSKTAILQTPAEMMMCGVIMGIDRHNARLNSSSGLGKTYNFYADPNVPEVQKLVSLVQDIQSRFLELAEIWPEHATIRDVLQVSSELMELRHIEPLAKIITKAEQVHSYVREWQIVASEEYSAVRLYEPLTSMLINWRRLELSTWARLLDMEDTKCIDEADSWWFLAYEVIIAVPLSAIHSGEDLQNHSEQLFAILADFLATTSIGQYSQRLRLIECFKSYLGLLVEQEPNMVLVQNTLINFMSFYVRFEKTIQEFLLHGRAELEKNMKEILLLASWKDTNITALRESAKRSHHKLFKVVRKYRALLAQSADRLIAQGVPDQFQIPEPDLETSSYSQIPVINPQALQIIRQHVPDWNLKRARFTNPVLTAKSILRMTQLPSRAPDNALYLECFADNLMQNIKALQKETPSRATEDNKEKVKHLKSQKRKLFADTLKSFRHMGFRSNISVEALAQQGSMAVILAKSATFELSSWESDFSMAEYHFHTLLLVMSQVREKHGDHSNDLSHGEISRSIGFLEGIVSIVLKQRVITAESRRNLDHLEKGLELMRNLSANQRYTIHRDQGTILDIEKTQHIINWLPGIIEAGCIIVQKYTELGGYDSATVIKALTYWKDRISNLVECYRRLPDLPIHLASSLHEEIRSKSEISLTELKADLQDLSEKNQHVGFVLRQIELWTDGEGSKSKTQRNGDPSISLTEFGHTISNLSDSILVAIQRVQDIILSLPMSDEDRGWLTKGDTTFTDCLRAFHSEEVNTILRDAMSKVCLLEAPNGGSFEAVGALCVMAMPIVQQYCDSLRTLLGHHIKFHRSLCKLATVSAQSFCQIATQGFCTPNEDSAQGAGNSEKLEGGTGLGEGEGVNDISKDVQDDEDLSELAQEPNEEKNKGDIEDQKDAVNMDQEDLEGDMGNTSENQDDDESRSEEGDKELDDETGAVDDLDPSAVDEKLWDGSEEETEKGKEGSQATGKRKNEQVAADSDQKTGNENSDADDGDNQSTDGVEETEQVGREDTQRIDPHLQEGQNLELPEDMDLDNGDQSSILSGSDENDGNVSSDNEQEDPREEQTGQFEDDNEGDKSTEEAVDKEEKIQNPQEIKETEDSLEQTERVGSPADTEPDNDESNTDTALLRDHTDDVKTNREDIPSTNAQGFEQDDHQEVDVQQSNENSAQGKEGAKGTSTTPDDPQAANEEGQLGQTAERSENMRREDLQSQETSGSASFKKLGDALEKWHRQQRQIQDAQESREDVEMQKTDPEIADQDFEHLGDEAAKADTQALGAATQEQANALNEQAFESQMQEQLPNTLLEEVKAQGVEDEDTPVENVEDHISGHDNHRNQSRHGAIIVETFARTHEGRDSNLPSAENPEPDIDYLDNELSTTHLQPKTTSQPRSLADALSLWTHYSTLTHTLSLTLTEQLRLILAPTLATKMRGDFRTGKRLNIKRIIPYIASSYKRDKIWMRRSVPQKRAYQILLAVDDSKSMGESSAGHLAFETLALVAKSLSMLEVGEICVVSFGAEVTVAHEFDKPFAVDAGVEVFRQFTFSQERTDVRKLLERSINLFREARTKSSHTGAADLWQLELIISDGVCEEHEEIRRLVRQAQEERIVILFVIVDAGKGESILDMSQAVFELDDDTDGGGMERSGTGRDRIGGGGTKLLIKRYLDGFPFAYYLVVGEVRELPDVLATALRQWFAEVVESG